MINSFYTIFYTCFFVFLVKIVSSTGYIFTNDTKNYINIHPNAQPVYSTFLYIIKHFTNPIFFKEIVISIQLIASYGIIIYFFNVLKRYFNFNFIIQILLFLLLTHPIYGSYKMCNKLVTEPIAYSMFLLFIASTIKWFFNKKDKHIYLIIIFLSILILTRAQFLSTSIAFSLFLLYEWPLQTIKKRFLLFFIVLTIPISTNIIEKTFYGVVKGHYVSRQLGNMSLATLPFFLSNSNDVNQMPDEESKHFFNCVYYSLEEKKLLANQLPSNTSNVNKYLSFHNNYAKICNQTIIYEGISIYKNNNDSYIEILNKSSLITGKTIRPLFMARPIEWLKIFYYNLAFPYHTIGFVIFLLILFLYFIFYKTVKKIKYQSLLFLFTSIILGNLFLICISIHSIRRYYMYFDIVVALLIILLLSQSKSIKKQ